jgi:hypothetical protein
MPIKPRELPMSTITGGEVRLLVKDTIGLFVGEYGATLDRIPWRDGNDLMNTVDPVLTGQVIHHISTSANTELAIEVKHSDPLPMTLLRMEVDLDIGGD